MIQTKRKVVQNQQQLNKAGKVREYVGVAPNDYDAWKRTLKGVPKVGDYSEGNVLAFRVVEYF